MTETTLPAREADEPFARLLRHFRTARRMSQLDLALDCDVSARHLSFLETGRARPSREMVLQLADGLILPLASRNALLHAAGFAPVYPASDLSSEALEPLRAVLQEMMSRHAPFPAMLCDRHWHLIDANPSGRALLAPLASGEARPNLVRLMTEHPLAASVIVNLPEMLIEMRGRIALEALEAANDPELLALLSGIEAAIDRHPPAPPVRRPLVPLTLRTPMGELRFLTTIAHFGSSEDVTVRDLRLELYFPADPETRGAMQAMAA